MPSIFDYKYFFDDYCKEHSLDLHLSFDMPSDYETACGTFDPASKTVFINAEHLNAKPDYEKAFFCFTNCVTHRSISVRNTSVPKYTEAFNMSLAMMVHAISW